jgi:hypothetical protein
MKTYQSLLLTIGAILILIGVVTWWHYTEFQKDISKINQTGFTFPEINLETENQETETFKEFIVPDGDFKITYPESWQKVEQSFESLDSENAKTLFYAIKTNIKNSEMAWLIVQKINYGEEKNLEKIVEEIKNSSSSQQIETEIQILENKENSILFKITQKQGAYSTAGEEKIILTENNIYSVLIFSLSSSWNSFQEEAKKILDSAQPLLK